MNNNPVDMGGFTLASDAPLGARNTLRVDARAKLLAVVRDPTKIPELLAYPAVKAGKVLVLGEGSNMLIKGDFDGTVLAMATRGVETFQRDDRVLIQRICYRDGHESGRTTLRIDHAPIAESQFALPAGYTPFDLGTGQTPGSR